MAGTPDKVLSRDFVISINTGTVAVPVWTPIGGLDEDGITFSPSSRDVDFADANDGGAEKTVPLGRGYSVALKGARMEAMDDGTRDPGQAAVEAKQDETGLDALDMYKVESPAAATPEAIAFKAWAEVNSIGGGDKSAWTATLHCYGIPTRT